MDWTAKINRAQTSIDVCAGVTCRPSLVLSLFTLCDSNKRSVVNPMFHAKRSYSANMVLITSGRNGNKHLHSMAVLFWLALAPFLDGAHFCDTFRGVFFAKPRLLTFFQCTHLLAGFWGSLFTKVFSIADLRCTHLCPSDNVVLPSQIGTGVWGKIEALVSKWLECINPMLFTKSQEFREKHQLQNFKRKCIFAVFVPRTLQNPVMVDFSGKLAAVFNPAPTQVGCTAHVNSPVGATKDAIYTRDCGDFIGKHIPNCLSLVPCLFRCQAGKATRFSQGLITPLLDSILILPFFPIAHKAEARR